jgi:hypothetical protein
MSADLRCFGCGESATRLATFKANPKVTRLTCEAGRTTFDADLWAVRKLSYVDWGVPKPVRQRKAVTA